MKYSYTWLKELTPKTPNLKVLEELLTMHTYQVEDIEKVGKDHVFDIDVLANRAADSAGHLGVAREIAVLTKSKIKMPKTSFATKGGAVSKEIKGKITGHTTQRLMLGYAEDIKIQSSPDFIQKRLRASGLRPINNIVDITNYIMLETGHPSHAFDADKISGGTIHARSAKSGEKITTLDDQKFSLTRDDTVIADTKGALSIAGVKGGKRAEVTNKTKRIIFEVAVFDRTCIRKTSQRLGIVTDASVRFSRGLSPDMVPYVLDRLLSLTEEYAHATIAKGVLDSYPKKRRLIPIRFRHTYAQELLGREIKESTMTDILKRLGCEVKKERLGVYKVTSPYWRMDLECEEDLVEEVGRIFGYHNIHAGSSHMERTEHEENNTHELHDRLRDHFMHRGMYEINSYAFDPKENDFESLSSAPRLEIRNPLSEGYVYLRGSLVPSMLRVVINNLKHEKEFSVFEIGTVFREASKKASEQFHLVFMLISQDRSETPYFRGKGMFEMLARRFGIEDIGFADVKDHDFVWPLAPRSFSHPFRTSIATDGSQMFGSLYQLHPSAGIDANVIIGEIILPVFEDRVMGELEYKDIPKFPAVMRDIAVLVPSNLPVDQVVGLIEITGGELLADSDLFDYYEGARAGDGRKSLAFHLRFQSETHTLTDEEVSNIYGRIVEKVRREGWEVRE